MTFTVEDVVEALAEAGVRLDRGLTEADLKRIEKKFGFSFGPDQRTLLRAALPLGDAWLNWRHATAAKIRERLQAPTDAVIFGVRSKDFWPEAWGARPQDAEAAQRLARERLARSPLLVPLYGQCYLPAAPASEGSPVFSVRPGEVSVCGADLRDFVTVEFGAGPGPGSPAAEALRVDFWSDLAGR